MPVEPDVTPLSRQSSCVVKVTPSPYGEPDVTPTLTTQELRREGGPSPYGEPDVTPTLTTQQLRRESVKVKISPFTPSRHSCCVVKV